MDYTMQVMPITQVSHQIAIQFSRRQREIRTIEWDWTEEETDDEYEGPDGPFTIKRRLICRYWEHFTIPQLMALPSLRTGEEGSKECYLVDYGTQAYRHWTSRRNKNSRAYKEEKERIEEEHAQYVKGATHFNSRHHTVPWGERYSGPFQDPIAPPPTNGGWGFRYDWGDDNDEQDFNGRWGEGSSTGGWGEGSSTDQ